MHKGHIHGKQTNFVRLIISKNNIDSTYVGPPQIYIDV